METIVPYIIGWPTAVVIIVCFFLILFRKPISDFLFSLEKIGGYGFSFKKGIPQKQPKGILLPQAKEELEKSVEKERNRAKFLFNQYWELFKTYTFEQSFNVIYGTQIKLLEHLSKKGALGDKYTNLENFYLDFFMRTRRKTTTTRGNHLGFLESRGYIKYAGEGDERIVKITPHGNNFLSYIKEQYKFIYKYKRF